MSFRWTGPIRFAHCDPAGIAYFPRLFDLVDAAVEDWTAAVLVPRAEMHGALRLGLPTVDLHAAFAVPCRLGELLAVDLAVTAVGRASLTLALTAHVAGEPRFTAQLTQALMNLDTARAQPWPAAWRERLA